jgi:pimeloyl-ACP methyl ester carboxylesterase
MSSGPGPVPHPAAENLGLLAKVLPDLDLATVWAAKAQLEAQAGVAPDPPETEAFLRRRFLANSPVALRRLADQLLSAPDSTYGIETLSLRVLVLNGDADDAWTPESQADYARRLGAEHVVVAGAGHSPAADAPAETAAALTAFWSAKG